MATSQGPAGLTRVGSKRYVVRVRPGATGVRDVLADLLELASRLAKTPDVEGILVLAEPKITPERMKTLWQETRAALSPDVSRRLHVITASGTEVHGIEGDLPGAVLRFAAAQRPQEGKTGERLPSPDFFFEILKILLRHWLLGQGPVTTRWIEQTAGCSYPTVRSALDRLESVITRHSDRSVELSRFPQAAWTELLAVGDRARFTVRYTDRSGQPRPPESLLTRLHSLKRNDIAVAGTRGARRWQPDLDLAGDPRLDLSIHCPEGRLDLGFVSELDPALTQTKDPGDKSVLVIHVVRRAESLWEAGDPPWADPVECLLDLHDLRLGSQAQEFVEFLRSRQDKK